MQPPSDPDHPPPQRPSPPDPGNESTPDPAFEQALQDLAAAVHQLQVRYRQVQRDRQRRSEIQQQLEQYAHQPELQSEFKRLKRQLLDLEIALESSLLSWISGRDRFWQIVRFGGLGIVIGWLLKSCTG